MAFKLNKGDSKRRDDLVNELREKAGKVEEAISTYNAEVEKLRKPLNAALAAYNETVGEARGFVEDIANQADSTFDEKSERRQESDKGQEASSWKDEWESAQMDDVDDITFHDLSADDLGLEHADTLEELPEASG